AGAEEGIDVLAVGHGGGGGEAAVTDAEAFVRDFLAADLLPERLPAVFVEAEEHEVIWLRGRRTAAGAAFAALSAGRWPLAKAAFAAEIALGTEVAFGAFARRWAFGGRGSLVYASGWWGSLVYASGWWGSLAYAS